MKKRILFLAFSLFSFQSYGLSLHFVPFRMKPGYSCVGFYGRMNDSKGIFISGDFAQRLSRNFGVHYDVTSQAILATGPELDNFFAHLIFQKQYSGRSLFLAQPDFRAAFQDLLYDQIDSGLLTEILPQSETFEKTEAIFRGLNFARKTAIVFALFDKLEFQSNGEEKIQEIFYHRSSFFSFFKN